VALFALIIGVIIVVAAFRNSQGALFNALGTDAPDFVVWAAAILAIGAIGFIPGLKTTSKLLLALIIVVIVVNNYKGILAGFQNAWKNPGAVPSSSGGGSQSGSTSGLSSFLHGFLGSDPFGNFLNPPSSGTQ
jgi:hypothetical protein